MTTTPFVNQYAQAAQRARTVADIARNRFADTATLAALRNIAAHLDAAADHFAAVPPGAYTELPTEACEALFRAEQIAVEQPAARFPAELGEYVLQPLTGRPLPMPAPLRPAAERLAVRETDLRNRLAHLHDDPAQWTHPDEWLRAVFTAWQKHMRLADEVRADNARPCHQR